MTLGSIIFAIYLGTCVASFGTNRVLNMMIKRRFKKEGYEIRKKRLSLGQKLLAAIVVAFINMFPFANVLSVRNGIINRERIYQETKRDFLESGALYRPEPICKTIMRTGEIPNLSDKEKMKDLLSAIPFASILTESFKDFQEVNMTIVNTDTIAEEKSFQDMTVEEKLKFLKEQREILTGESPNPEDPEEDFRIR